MDLYPWEKEAYEELKKMYTEFFMRLSELGMHCFRIDSKELFCKNVKELSDSQKEEIQNFWNKYIDDLDLNYHAYYIDRFGQFDVRFIPDDIFAGYIDGYLNNRTIEAGVSDKNYLDLYLAGFKMPRTILHYINGYFEDSSYSLIDKDSAIKKLVNEKKFIVKPSMASYGGEGVKIFVNATFEELEKYIDELDIKNLIFQEVVEQHEMTGMLHPQSLNTIRVMTLLIDDVKVLHSAFRMGVGNTNVDNASKGGIYCSINNDGRLSDFAYDAKGNLYNEHPDGGSFSQVQFEFMEKINSMVKKAALRFPHFRLIGWDVAVGKDSEPIIIEANLTMSGMDVIETICGPLFGEYTEQVLEEIFLKKKKASALSMDILQYL